MRLVAGFIIGPSTQYSAAFGAAAAFGSQMTSSRQSISHRPETRTVTDIQNLFENDLLNLEPGFQRQSVWSERDRAKLIDSILRNYPLPAIFFYRREEIGRASCRERV